jgi:hypothetical protein
VGIKDSSAGGTVHVRRTVGLQGLLVTTLLATHPEPDTKLGREMYSSLCPDHICCHVDPVLWGLVPTVSRLLENTDEQQAMHNGVEPPYHKLGLQSDKRHTRHVDTASVADKGEVGN